MGLKPSGVKTSAYYFMAHIFHSILKFSDMNAREKVRKYYDSHYKDEDRRLDEHPFEIPVTMHFVDKYLKGGERIFDVACGTGRIAKILLDKGFKLGLNDLSEKNISLSKERLLLLSRTVIL